MFLIREEEFATYKTSAFKLSPEVAQKDGATDERCPNNIAIVHIRRTDRVLPSSPESAAPVSLRTKDGNVRGCEATMGPGSIRARQCESAEAEVPVPAH